jgi:type I restriction enzyme S subunit
MTVPTDWQTKTLGSLLSYEQPTPFLVVSTDYLEFSSVPVLTAGKTFILGYTDEEHGVYSSLPVILFDDFTTACQWVDFRFKVKSSAAKILSGRVGVSDTKFMYEYLSRLSFVPSDHQRHWISVFSSIEVFVPPLKEQKAIAEALSDVDALIDSLEALLTKKRNIETGVMQELLTGRTRLPGFSGEWQAKRLGNVAELVSGGTPSTTVAAYWGGSIPWCTPTDITATKGITITNTAQNISAEGVKSSSATILPVGSILLCTRATIGEARITTVPITTNQGFKSLVVNAEVNNVFLYFLMTTMKNKLRERSSGSTFLEISKNELASFELNIPEQAEQEAIAAVLSDLNDEIEKLEKRLAKTRDLKQGMAQELLTGRTRLV